jgi:hypothetical protein
MFLITIALTIAAIVLGVAQATRPQNPEKPAKVSIPVELKVRRTKKG